MPFTFLTGPEAGPFYKMGRVFCFVDTLTRTPLQQKMYIISNVLTGNNMKHRVEI